MLVLTGKCLGVASETINGASGSFVSTEMGLQVGSGMDMRVERVRVGRDFPGADLPKEGDSLSVEVFVSAFSGRNGAGYRLVAVRRVAAVGGARVAAAS